MDEFEQTFFATFFLFLFSMLITPSVHAFTSPVGFSLLTIERDVYLEFPGPRDNVCGLRLNLLRSMNDGVCGLDLGVGLNVADRLIGIQIAGIGNTDARARIFGLQFGGLFNTDGEAYIVGLQFSILRNGILSSATLAGIQVSLFNDAYRTDVYGFQLSLINRARKVVGLQVGLFNSAEELYGVQLGLINLNQKGPFKFFPVINVGM